jgi:hypothetical protein
MRVLSGENATEQIASVWPWRGSQISEPDKTSRIQTVRSSEPEAMRVPSGENATDVTKEECPQCV